MAASEKILYNFVAQTASFVSNVGKADKEMKEFDTDTKKTTSSMSKLYGSAKKFAGLAVGGLGVKELAQDTLTLSANQAILSDELGLSNKEANQYTRTLYNQNKAYGFNKQQITAVAALNSRYTSSLEQTTTATKTVAQASALYALKEGDISKAGENATEVQEALRDTVLNGSATAYEDAGLSVDKFATALINANGWSDAQVATITQGLEPGTNAYTEALLTASDQSARFTAITQLTNQEMQGLTANLGLAGNAALLVTKNMNMAKNVLMALGGVIVIVVAAILELIGALFKLGVQFIQNITQTDAYKNSVSVLGQVLQFIQTTIIPPLITVLTFLGQVFAYLATNILPIIIDKFQLFAQIALQIAQIVLPPLITLFTFLAKVIGIIAVTVAPILVNVFQILYNTMVLLAPIIIGLVQGFVAIATTIAQFLLPILAQLISFIAYLWQALQPLIQALLNFGRVILELVQVIIPPLVSIIQVVIAILGTLASIILSIVLPVIETLATILINSLTRAFNIVSGIIETVIIPIFEKLAPIIEKAANIFLELASIVQDVVVIAFKILQPILEKFFDIVQKIFNIVKKLLSPIKALANALKGPLLTAVNALLSPLEKLFNLLDKILGLISKVTGAISGALSHIPFIGGGSSATYTGNINAVPMQMPNNGGGGSSRTTTTTNTWNVTTKQFTSLRDVRRMKFITTQGGVKV